MDNTPKKQKSPLLPPSPRVTAALAAAMLAIGVAVGAAIGPAPSPSFAGASGLPLPLLLRSLGVDGGASAHPGVTAGTSGVQAPVAQATTPSPVRHRRRRKNVAAAQEPASTTTSPAAAPESSPPSSSAPAGKPRSGTLAPVTKVWLIELSGAGFSEAAANPSAASYIDTQAIGQGALLSGWSALDGSAFASEAALLASSPPLADPGRSVLDTIVQPPCPEGAGAAQCAADTPGGLTAADQFLQQTLPTITTTAAYRENGLIVVTFATVASATATGLPSGATTATLTAQPPAGVLLISPFVTAGARPSEAFSATSPTQSLEKLLHH
jgi:hypothetical protein